jgi:hypothetical protein
MINDAVTLWALPIYLANMQGNQEAGLIVVLKHESLRFVDQFPRRMGI